MEKEYKRVRIEMYNKYTNKLNEKYFIERGRAFLNNHIYLSTLSIKRKIEIIKRPTFIEWLFRKERTIIFEIKASEILENPSANKDYIYDVIITE